MQSHNAKPYQPLLQEHRAPPRTGSAPEQRHVVVAAVSEVADRPRIPLILLGRLRNMLLRRTRNDKLKNTIDRPR